MIIAFSIISLKLVLTLASVQIVIDAKKLELLGIVTRKFNGSSWACNLFIVTVTHEPLHCRATLQQNSRFISLLATETKQVKWKYVSCVKLLIEVDILERCVLLYRDRSRWFTLRENCQMQRSKTTRSYAFVWYECQQTHILVWWPYSCWMCICQLPLGLFCAESFFLAKSGPYCVHWLSPEIRCLLPSR